MKDYLATQGDGIALMNTEANAHRTATTRASRRAAASGASTAKTSCSQINGDTSHVAGQSVRTPRLAYSITELSRSVGISRDLIYAEIKNGRLKVTKIGDRTVIPLSSIEAWLNRPAGSPPQPPRRGPGRPRKLSIAARATEHGA
jgi:excisionase family DNA binding protein